VDNLRYGNGDNAMSVAQDDNGMHLAHKVYYYEDSFRVETYELSVGHGPERNQHYETLVDGVVKERYEGEQEAKDGHEHIKEMLKNGNYERECISYQLILGDNDE
jgi:hypothetical protein